MPAVDGGFRSPMTRAEENNAKEHNGNRDRIDLDRSAVRRHAARPERRPDHHARDAGSGRALRPPDQALEPEDEARSSSARATASTSSTCSTRSGCSSAPTTSWSRHVAQRRLGAVRRHQEAGAGSHPGRGAARAASSSSPTAGSAARSPTSRRVKGSIERLRAIEKMAEDGTFERMTKKEVLGLDARAREAGEVARRHQEA